MLHVLVFGQNKGFSCARFVHKCVCFNFVGLLSFRRLEKFAFAYVFCSCTFMFLPTFIEEVACLPF